MSHLLTCEAQRLPRSNSEGESAIEAQCLLDEALCAVVQPPRVGGTLYNAGASRRRCLLLHADKLLQQRVASRQRLLWVIA